MFDINLNEISVHDVQKTVTFSRKMFEFSKKENDAYKTYLSERNEEEIQKIELLLNKGQEYLNIYLTVLKNSDVIYDENDNFKYIDKSVLEGAHIYRLYLKHYPEYVVFLYKDSDGYIELQEEYLHATTKDGRKEISIVPINWHEVSSYLNHVFYYKCVFDEVKKVYSQVEHEDSIVE